MEPIWNPLYISETIIITVFDLESYGTLKEPFMIIGSAEKNYYFQSGTVWNPYGTHMEPLIQGWEGTKTFNSFLPFFANPPFNIWGKKRLKNGF